MIGDSAGTLRPPDGAAHDVTLKYFGTRLVERRVPIATASGVETTAITTETYDRQGRLAKVSEPSGAADAQVATTYSYDVGNRLRQVQTTSGGVTQNRFFTYDNRGFLSSETHPEKGAAGNGTVTYSNYDARGHVGRKVEPSDASYSSDLTFVYDSAERLTLVRETATARTLKSFTYGGANGTYVDPVTGGSCFDFRQGKITQQSRFNYVTVNGGPFTVELREAMNYCGRDGRMSRRSLENWVNGGAAPSETFFLPNVTYDALGNVTSLDYPRCTHGACTAPSPRTVTSSYTNGFLTAVGNPSNAGYYASSITYHPNLMVNQVVHNNNPVDATKSLTDTYANDPNAMRRPASITVTTPTAAVRWSTGSYGYDGAGNVKAIGTHTFTYDLVSRLKAGTLYLEPTNSVTQRTQTYTYDAFGNMLTIGGSSARNTPTSAATNRLTSGTYDAGGNLTGWNGNTYKYDPLNLMWDYRTGSGEEWIYMYTADDERAWTYKIGNTSLWTLRGPDGKVLREYTSGATWAVDSDYIYRDGSLLAAETPQGIRHFHLDHLGTPRLISDSFGQQKTYHVYYPFGEEATAFNQDTIRAKFTGHERDLGNLGGAGDDLDYMHARFCSPLTGRFLSVDTGQSAKPPKPQSWNRYSYSRNNPITRFDPDGQVDQNFTPLVFPDDPIAQMEFDNRVAVGTTVLGAATLGGIAAIEAGAVATLSRLITGLSFGSAPAASNPQLQGIINQLFKSTDTLRGGTAGAIMRELATGTATKGRIHIQAGLERLLRLEGVVQRGGLTRSDARAAEGLIRDLRTALEPVLTRLNMTVAELYKALSSGQIKQSDLLKLVK
jgi:RHS repeat-associated protein